jgi:hypothetical protein
VATGPGRNYIEFATASSPVKLVRCGHHALAMGGAAHLHGELTSWQGQIMKFRSHVEPAEPMRGLEVPPEVVEALGGGKRPR